MFKNFCNERHNLFSTKRDHIDLTFNKNKFNGEFLLPMVNNKDIDVKYSFSDNILGKEINMEVENWNNFCVSSKHNNYVAGFAFNHEELKPSLLLGYDTDNIKGNILLDKGNNLNDTNIKVSFLANRNNIYSSLMLNTKFNKYNKLETLIGYKNNLCDTNISFSKDFDTSQGNVMLNSEGNIMQNLTVGAGLMFNPSTPLSSANAIGKVKYSYNGNDIGLKYNLNKKISTLETSSKISDNVNACVSLDYDSNFVPKMGFGLKLNL